MPPKRGYSASEDVKGSPVRQPPSEQKPRESPLKRLKAAMRQRAVAQALREELILSTVDEFRAHVMSRETLQPPDPDVEVIVRGTVLWKSEHAFSGRNLVRLHVTDASPEETIEEFAEFQTLHGSSDANRIDVDSLLLTVTVFGETLASPNLPANGSVIRIVNSRRRLVFEGRFCQLVARPTDITVE